MIAILLTACLLKSKDDNSIEVDDTQPSDTADNSGTAPVFSFVSPVEGDVFAEGTAILFEGIVVDAEDVASDVALSWSSSIDGDFSDQVSDSTGSVTFSTDVLSAGAHSIRVLATDSSGLTDSVDLNIRINALPTVVTPASIDPSSAFTGSSLSCDAEFFDSEDGELTASYEWTIDGVTSSTEATLTLDKDNSDVGDELSCTASAVDSDGESISSIASLSIENSLPTITDVLISPSTAIKTDTLTCTASVDDPDEDVAASFSWEDANGQLLGSGDVLDLSQTSLSAGDSVFCLVDVVDSDSGQASESASLEISNTAPVLSLTAPADGSTFAFDANVAFSATLSDLEESPENISIEWSSSLDGSLSTQAADPTGHVSLNTDQLSAGVHQITLQATDSFGDSTAISITLNINMHPSAPSVSISPSLARTSDDLLATATGAVDPEGDTISYSYEWFKNGVPTGLTATSVSNSETAVSELWTVHVIANDGYSDGPVGTASITIANTNPVLDSPAITPALVYNDTLVDCSATVTDPDGPSIPSISWSLNGQFVATGNGLDLSTTAAMPDDTLLCDVSVDDGNGGSDSLSVSTTIQNRSPSVTSISIAPSEPFAGVDDVLCEVLGSDPDGETLNASYEWLEAGGDTYSGATLPSSLISAGEIWTCTGTLSDTGFSVSDSLDVTILSPCAFSDCDVALDLGNGSILDMNLIPAGQDALARFSLSNDFYIMTTEVTQGMYEALFGTLWSSGQSVFYGVGPDYPVYYIHWHMMADYANALTSYHNSFYGTSLSECYSCTGSSTSVSCTANDPYTCTGYRHPTEAEWDYAARSGTTADFWTEAGGGYVDYNACISSVKIIDYVDDPFLSDYAWFCGNSVVGNDYALHDVAQKWPNGFGLYDMQGNVLEWVLDSVGGGLPYNGVTTDPVNIDPTAANRIFRGGMYSYDPEDIRLERRIQGAATARNYPYGFRLVRLASP